MKKKYLNKLILIMLIASITSLPVQADTTPSTWAVTEVEQAKAQGLVDETFNQNYQQPIKRYEYVLLALKVLDKKGYSVEIIQKYPFSDILGHDYENEIVRAYNAGLINGYSDGTFKPNQEITREEIAALIYNLAKKINSDIILQATEAKDYSDSKLISNWAKKYIDYCYINGILQGVGKNREGLDKIDPKGNALIEQAIALVYRFANKQDLLKTYNLGTVQIVKYPDISYLDDSIDSNNENITKTYETSNIINDFAVTFGEELALNVKKLAGEETIDLINMSNTYATLDINGTGSINIIKTENEVDLNLITTNLEDDTLFEYYYQLAGNLNDLEQLKIAIDRCKSGLKDSKNFIFSEPINQNDYFKAFSNTMSINQYSDEIIQYAFQYQHGLF